MALTLTRDFFIPRAEFNATKLESKTGNGIAYAWIEDRAGKKVILAKGFSGKRNKPDFYHNFGSVEKRDAHVAKFLEEADETFNRKAKAKVDAKAEKAALDCRVDLPVGTVLVQSWGWEQTNIDFFQVVEHVSRTKLKVQKIGATSVPHGGGYSSMSDHCIADPTHKGEIIEVRQDGKGSISVPDTNGYAWGKSATLWDGKPRYRSWYA